VKMIKYFKNRVISAFSDRGVLIQKKNPLNSEDKLISVLLKKHNIDLVLDVGANKGQFAIQLLKSAYTGQIISFEPLPGVYDELKQLSDKYSKWQTENLAVGNELGSISINVSENTESSSVLPMLNSHFELAPESKYINAITVPITTLDQYFSENKIVGENVFLKIDVQGYEDSVISGSLNLLKQVKVLQLEISFTPLYEKSLVYYKMMQKLEETGFSLYTLLPAFSDYKTGQVFQVDAVYVKK
jgi:FkbM family methyltransferase